MAYEPKTWECGEVVTADALNNMEQGIADAYELPSVTSADNGKILGVDNGEYALIEQSGGTPSIIKIAEWYGTYTSTGDAPYWFGGGGQFLNGKSLSELVGDKTIIGLALEGVDEGGTSNQSVSALINMSVDGYPLLHNLIVHQDEIKQIPKNKVGGNMMGYSSYRLKNGTPISIYAICI